MTEVTEIPAHELHEVHREIYKKQYTRPSERTPKQRKQEAELIKQLYGEKNED